MYRSHMIPKTVGVPAAKAHAVDGEGLGDLSGIRGVYATDVFPEGHLERQKSWGPGALGLLFSSSPFLMGKSTISMAMFNSYVKLPEGISNWNEFQKPSKTKNILKNYIKIRVNSFLKSNYIYIYIAKKLFSKVTLML